MEVTKSKADLIETRNTLTSSNSSPNDSGPDLSSRADHQLLELFRRNRDSVAFTVLVERHHGMIFGIAKRMLGCSHTAEDVVQATFLVLAKDSRKIRKRHSLVSWLYGVAYRISARSARQQAKTTVSTLEDKVMVTADPLEKLNEQYEQETVFEELHRLPENLRAPLVLRYLKGNSNQEVADELKLSESAVEGRMKRGRKQLRLRLARKGVTFAFGIGVLNLVQREVAAQNLPHMVSSTLAACASSVGGNLATGSSIETGVSHEATRLAEEEILKMATTKLISMAVMASAVIGMVASGWALTTASAPNGQQAGSVTELNVSSDPSDSSLAALPTVSVNQTTQESDPDPTPTSSGPTELSSEFELTVEQRRQNAGHYSIETMSENELMAYEQLKKNASFDYFETRFEDVAAEIAAKHGIRVHLDLLALSDSGHDEETLITFKIDEIELGNAMELMLGPMELAAIVKNEVLLITTKDVAEETLTTRVYNLRPEWHLSVEDLQLSINDNIEPDFWDSNGGRGTMSQIPEGLVVSANHKIHDNINKLLAQFDKLYADK